MKKTTFVALLLLSCPCVAETLNESLSHIESEWAVTYYKTPKIQQESAYLKLLSSTQQLSGQYPHEAAPLFWQAVVKASYADHQDAVSALDAIDDVRDLLTRAIAINPNTMNGSAYVVLGTLYYRVPKWPIAFGNDEEADKLLQAALKINPNGIDSNYYYGEFLLANDKIKAAESYLKKATEAPVRPEQIYADNQLKEEAKRTLKNTQERKMSGAKSLFLSLFNSASAK
jgi:tetratricopeptide (TPR) repeat protein